LSGFHFLFLDSPSETPPASSSPAANPLQPERDRIEAFLAKWYEDFPEDLVAEKLREREKKERALLAQRQKLIGNIRFRLTGWSESGERTDLESDIQNTVVRLEKPLVTDPQELQRAMEELRLPGADLSAIKRQRFVSSGEHVFLAPEEKLLYERERGFQVVAMFRRSDGTEKPIGYSHGLEEIPERDPKFPNLELDTLVGPMRDIVRAQRQQWAVIWRTGVSENLVLDAEDMRTLEELGVELDVKEGDSLSLRRLGIATVLKYLDFLLLYARGKSKVTLNVGTIFDQANPDDVQFPNAPSTLYNTNMFTQDFGWRAHADNIGRTGKVVWRAYGGKLADMIAKLRGHEKSPLKKHGWNMNDLMVQADTMYLQILKEISSGQHKN
jgi:hypothetical protein